MIEHLKIALRRQQRLIALFLLTIFLPSALLSFFGIRAIRNEHFRLIEQAVNEQLQAADLLKARVRTRMKALESRLLSLAQDPSIAGPDEDAKRQLLRDRVGEDPMVDLVFVIYGDGNPLYPLFQSHTEDGTLRARTSLGETGQLRLREAQHLEFVQKDYEAASTVYQRLLRGVKDRNDQALLLGRLARNFSKAKEYRRAVETYERIQEDFPAGRTSSGIPLGLIAKLEKPGCYRMLGEPMMSLDAALEAYEDVVRDSWGLTESQFKAYASQGREVIETAIAEAERLGLGDKEYNEMVEQLKGEHKARLEMWEIIRVLERESLPELRRQWSERGSMMELPLRQVNTIDGEDLIVTAVLIPGEAGQSSTGLLGVKLSNDYLEGELLSEIAAEIGIVEGSSLTVSNLSGRRLHGTPAASSEEYVQTTAFFEDGYPPWRIALADLEVGRSGFPSIYRSFYFWTILTLIAVLVFGVVLVTRTVGHEMELLKIKSDFVSSVSHEFKTPLTSIKALTERLLDGKVRHPAKMREYFSVISRDTERLTRLVGNLLDFSRIEEGRRQYELARTDVAEWLNQTVCAFRCESLDRQSAIRTHIASGIPDVDMDGTAMAQALENLLDNAIKFSGEKKEVDLVVEYDGGEVLIRVRDYGIGIPQEDQSRIFEKFYQGKGVPRTSARGTGLGLTLVKHTVEAHGGSVAVESRVGEGSTFTMTLPIRGTTE